MNVPRELGIEPRSSTSVRRLDDNVGNDDEVGDDAAGDDYADDSADADGNNAHAQHKPDVADHRHGGDRVINPSTVAILIMTLMLRIDGNAGHYSGDHSHDGR